MVDAADRMDLDGVAHMAANSPSWQSSDELDQLACPVLLVNGVWEKAFQPHVADARGAIADLMIVNLEGGHSINVEQPDAFNDAVVAFLSR